MELGGAPCPVLGRDCPRGKVKALAAVNIMMHNWLQRVRTYTHVSVCVRVSGCRREFTPPSQGQHNTTMTTSPFTPIIHT
jgi:hypothetical protein